MVKQTHRNTRSFSIAALACTANRPTKTPLFEAILRCGWTDIHGFLITNTWTTDAYIDSTMPAREQAQEWTTYYDSYSQQRLRQLPLHAAITHLSPLQVVQALVDVYPEAAQLPDGQGNLPLHIAFMTNAKDVASFLLKLNPEGLMEINEEGSLPIECYHHLFRTVISGSLSHIDEAEVRDQKELRELELQVAKDEHEVVASQKELREIRQRLQRLNSRGDRMIRSLLTTEEYRTGSVDL